MDTITKELFQLETTNQQVEAMIAHFFPYMILHCNTSIKNAETNSEQNLKELIVFSLCLQVQGYFLDWFKQRKKGTTCTIHFTGPEAITVVLLLRQLPLPDKQNYLIDLRDEIIQKLERLLWP